MESSGSNESQLCYVRNVSHGSWASENLRPSDSSTRLIYIYYGLRLALPFLHLGWLRVDVPVTHVHPFTVQPPCPARLTSPCRCQPASVAFLRAHRSPPRRARACRKRGDRGADPDPRPLTHAPTEQRRRKNPPLRRQPVPRVRVVFVFSPMSSAKSYSVVDEDSSSDDVSSVSSVSSSSEYCAPPLICICIDLKVL